MKPQQLEQQESVKELVEPQPIKQPQKISLHSSESSKAKQPIKLLTEGQSKPYQRLIELIMQIPEMKELPKVRYRLLPKNLRVRRSRFEQDPVKDLNNIIDWVERYDALPKMFANLWIEFDAYIPKDDKDQRNRIRKELDEIRKELTFPSRKIHMEQGQIPIECRRFLRNELNTRFSLNDLRTICYDLGIDFEILEGPEKTGKVISLLLAVEHQHRVNELIDICKSERPYVDWDC